MTTLQIKGEVIVPDRSTPPSQSVSRWSDKGIIAHPALVVVPESEEDIKAAINYAQSTGLQVLPAGGGHGSFVPIGSKTLYMNMKQFNQVSVNSTAHTITVAGGVLTGQVIKAVTEKGFYTTWTNSNAVGFIGGILGGGNPTLAGIHGMQIDQVLSVRLVTGEGKALEVSPSSMGDELALFNAICGAGHGFGVITSLTLKIFPISNLHLAEEGVWVRRLIFPPPALETAATVFEKLQPLSPESTAALVFARAPPTAPKPGAPMVILTVTYYGPATDAESAFPILFDKAVTSKTIVAVTAPTQLAKLNDALAHFDVKGDRKDIQSAALSKVVPETITTAFQKWLVFTEQYADAKRTTLVLSSYSKDKNMEISQSPEGKARYFDNRDRGFNVLIFSWSSTDSTEAASNEFSKEIKALYRSGSLTSELPRTLLNNIAPDTKADELFTENQAKELKRLVGVWDPTCLFWRPLI
ncbi:hypothetical protein N7478_010953 [Penicillium angulare]|uniref:uncharacterized protein n=1 Tax=Penicillium angulare TaxID=116970 RepID=UPI00253FF2AB|nr:uncharacterized protein N7478_010953 [Penicillium angulare]KAJ5263348.1 hypothetical protein N7478_010953 [Penicillium angulare]